MVEMEKERKNPKTIVRTVVSLIILSIGIVIAIYLLETGPKSRKKKPRQMSPLVQVIQLELSSELVIVHAMGTVIPAQEFILKSRVSGEVIEINPEFTTGGLIEAQEKILRIDPTDYELAVAGMKSQVANAIYGLKLELGHQEVAKREWELFNKKKRVRASDKELALRTPQLEKARAELAAAEADLKLAELNLSRTMIEAPFNLFVKKKYVEKGSQVSALEKLAELVGTGEYHVLVSIPMDRLKWIVIPRKTGVSGSSVLISYGNDQYEQSGTVIKLLGDLSSEGRMARILVSIPDPLNLIDPEINRPPVLIGEYVRIKIMGKEIPDVFRIPRSALRDNETVWIAQKDGILSIRQVNPVWGDNDTVLLNQGVNNGEQMIVSDLGTPVNGMPVRVSNRKAVYE